MHFSCYFYDRNRAENADSMSAMLLIQMETRKSRRKKLFSGIPQMLNNNSTIRVNGELAAFGVTCKLFMVDMISRPMISGI